MRLEKASDKAIKFACMNFHYAKAIPAIKFGYSVFNEKNEWCGVILYGYGATPNIGKFSNLNNGQALELVRMALNGKQNSTSRAMALSLKLLKKDMPLVKLVISYADIDQFHYGTIYQACNWHYIGDTNCNVVSGYIINGKKTHPKSLHTKGLPCTLNGAKQIDPNATIFVSKGKRKYIYPLCKSMLPLCKQLAKPYPKKALEVHAVEHLTPSQEVGGSSPTPALQNREKTEDNAE